MNQATRKNLLRIGGLAVIAAAFGVGGAVIYLVIDAFIRVVLEVK